MKLIETKKNGTKVYLDDQCPRCGGAGQADNWWRTGKTCYECGGTGKRREPRIVKVTAAQAAASERKTLLHEANALGSTIYSMQQTRALSPQCFTAQDEQRLADSIARRDALLAKLKD